MRAHYAEPVAERGNVVVQVGADEVGAEGEETEGVSNSGGRF